MALRDEDSISDQIYEKQIFSAFYNYEDLDFSANPMLECIFVKRYENEKSSL